jgi:hypothetical protein
MRIDIYHHIDVEDSVTNKLDELLSIVRNIQRKEVILMKEVDDLIVEVAAVKGEEESTSAALDSILAYIKAILDKIANTVDPAVIKGLTDQLATYRAALAAKKQEVLDAIALNPNP